MITEQIARRLNIDPADVESATLNWTAPQGRVAVFLGPNSNVTNWYYTVVLRGGEIRSLRVTPTQAEIIEFVAEHYPQQLHYTP